MELKLIASAIFIVLLLMFGYIVYGQYVQKEEVRTIEVFANGERYTCNMTRNDSWDTCVSDSGKPAYIGELK